MKYALRTAVVLVLALGAIALPSIAMAAPAATNDDFANATVINPASLPYSDEIDTSATTTEAGEPGGGCFFSGQTVWYSFTPSANGVFHVDTSASDYLTVANVYHGSSINSLSFDGCGYWYQGPNFRATANTTYYVQVGSYFSSGGTLRLTFSQVPPPPNDDFADATVVSPGSSDSQSGLAATLESGEPVASCTAFGAPNNSWWYSFTPASSGSYTITYSGGLPTVAVYTGSSLGSLSEQACRSLGGSSALTFAAAQGTTYYIQIGDYYAGTFGGVNFSLNVAPNPNVWFSWNPADPSSFDTVQFYDGSSDPGGNAFSSKVWDFGDGTVVTNPGQFPTHRYLADGDYEVKLTVTTTDGRTASLTQTIQIRTHDVSIAKFLVPQSASAGQTRTIAIGISNRRYAETVEVDLYKSTPQGFVLAGSLTQSVPVRPAGRTTDFKINYTFTNDDASLGKVTFKAVATIVGHRDALPSDNEAIALPTTVGR
jgi:hypothetical protein